MKALVLAGGAGTRLRPVTYTSAKQLVPIANKPVLFYGLKAIRDAAITDVGIVVGDTAREIKHAVGDGSQFGLHVNYIQQEAPLGLAHAILIARDYLDDENFVMYLGDNFIQGGIASFVEQFQAEKPAAQILLTPVPNPSEFGVAVLGDDGHVAGLIEKPAHPPSNLALVGVCVFGPPVHDAVRAIVPSARGELEITDAIQFLIDSGADVRSQTITGYWKDTGTVTDLLEANRCVLDVLPGEISGVVKDCELVGRVEVAGTAELLRCRIVGPVIIGPNATIVDSYVGPYTSIGPDCTVKDAEIRYSIVMPGARIVGVRPIEASLLGREVEIAPAPGVRQAYRLVLGDHSRVQVRR